MNSLAEDRDEAETAKLKGWIARKRREAGLAPEDPSTWFAYLEPDDKNTAEQALVTLGRSPADVLYTAYVYATARCAVHRGTGRWLVENNGGADDSASVYLVVRPALDREAPRYDEEEL